MLAFVFYFLMYCTLDKDRARGNRGGGDKEARREKRRRERRAPLLGQKSAMHGGGAGNTEMDGF